LIMCGVQIDAFDDCESRELFNSINNRSR
jgi:hypothetical protein